MKAFKYLFFAILAICGSFTSCSDENGGGSDIIEDLVEDGIYISGEALPFSGVDTKGRLVATTNEADGNSPREGLYDLYVTLKKDKPFSFTEVSGATRKTYGPDGNVVVDQKEVADEYTGELLKGKYKEGGTFSVKADGLYHIALDKTSSTFVVMPVTQWCLIGSVSDGGWGDNEEVNVMKPGAFNNTKMEYKVEGITLKEGEFKFRHSCAWKQSLDEEGAIKINTNFSGTAGSLTGSDVPFTNLVAGGNNATLDKGHRGVYTATMTWELGKGHTVKLTKTGEADIKDYPDQLFIRGNGANGWDEGQGIEMIGVPEAPHQFWAIVYLQAKAGEEKGQFKFETTNGAAWKDDFGADGEATEIEGGVEYAKGTNNINTPEESGYYTITVDMKANKIAITAPKVYMIGDAIGSWDPAFEAGLFTLSGDEFVSPAFIAADKDIRMYASTPYTGDWWKSEFIILEGKIAYRGDGGDQDRVKSVEGQKAYLNFKTGEGSIK